MVVKNPFPEVLAVGGALSFAIDAWEKDQNSTSRMMNFNNIPLGTKNTLPT